MAQFCSKCGSEIKLGSKFCGKCGNPVAEYNDQDTFVQSSANTFYQEKSAETLTSEATKIENTAVNNIKISGSSILLKIVTSAAALFIISTAGSYLYFSNRLANGADIPAPPNVDSVPVSQATMLKDMATIVAKGEVNMRATPTTNASSVGVVREGEQVEVLEKGTCNDSSAAIVINDEIYYQSGNNRITLGKGKPVQIIGEGNGMYNVSFTINERNVTVYGDSSYFTKLYGTTWYKVTANGQTGWIYSAYARMDV